MPPEIGTPNPDQHEKPKGFKEHCRLVWDSFWEFANLQKLGNHLLGEIPTAMKRAPILFILCLAILLFREKVWLLVLRLKSQPISQAVHFSKENLTCLLTVLIGKPILHRLFYNKIHAP